MTRRNVIPTLVAVSIISVLSACGGGSSSGNGGGNGGNGSNGLSISLLEPSSMMTGLPLGSVTVSGKGFSDKSVVLVDGANLNTVLLAPGTLQAEIPISFWTEVGVHQFTVQKGGATSNSLPFTIYTPRQGPQVMNAIPGFPVGFEANPPFLVAADVNGDGLSDIVMVGPGNNIAILYGQRDGTLSLPQLIPISIPPNALAVGDVNGDGNLDLVFAAYSNSNVTVSVMLGDGHGNFQAATAQQTFAGNFPGPAYLADLDGDGKPDLVLATQVPTGLSASLVWLRNTGNGSFAAPVTLALPAILPFLVVDVNGDGKPDIVYTASGATQSVHILLNQGGGNFKDQVAGGLNGITGLIATLDFNLDGIPDLVIQSGPGQTFQFYSFAGNGDGSFTQVAATNLPLQAGRFAVGDFDHDGFPDLVAPAGSDEPSSLMYLFGDGRGNFVAQVVAGPAGPLAVSGDFNGDGLPDVVVPDQDNFVSLALGRTDRNFPSAFSLSPATATSVSTGDITGNGLLDVLIGGDSIHGIPATVFLNQGNSTFQFAAHTDPTTFMFADFTGRGLADLIGGNGPNMVIWPNNLSPDFSSSPITVPQEPVDGPITIADMDGDGHADVVALGEILYGNGSYQFTAVPMATSFPAPYVVGNFTGSGRLDIATGTVTYLNMGNRSFQRVANTVPLTNGALTAVADFNGDGKDDIAIVLPGDTSISIYYSRGDGTFYQGTWLDAGQYVGALAAGDFDNDGRADLAAGLEFSHQGCMFFNIGQGQFSRSCFATGADTTAMVAADLNHRGKVDLVITNFIYSFAPANADVVFHK